MIHLLIYDSLFPLSYRWVSSDKSGAVDIYETSSCILNSGTLKYILHETKHFIQWWCFYSKFNIITDIITLLVLSDLTPGTNLRRSRDVSLHAQLYGLKLDEICITNACGARKLLSFYLKCCNIGAFAGIKWFVRYVNEKDIVTHTIRGLCLQFSDTARTPLCFVGITLLTSLFVLKKEIPCHGLQGYLIPSCDTNMDWRSSHPTYRMSSNLRGGHLFKALFACRCVCVCVLGGVTVGEVSVKWMAWIMCECECFADQGRGDTIRWSCGWEYQWGSLGKMSYGTREEDVYGRTGDSVHRCL